MDDPATDAGARLDRGPLGDDAATVLDNAVWHALRGVHEGFAETHGTAHRYLPDVSVFAAIGDDSEQSWRDLATLVGPGGVAVLFATDVPDPPAGWRVHERGGAHQMVIETIPEVDAGAALRPLGDADVPAMLELIALARPGPFRPRTIELGGYLGAFEAGRLVAMAGRRFRPPGYAEISAVCTHPSTRGRRLGAGLTAAVAHQIRADGIEPFLHVAQQNERARHVYEQLGFRTRAMTTVGIFRAPGAADCSTP